MHHELIGAETLDFGIAEEQLRRAFELNCDFSDTLRETLASAQIKRNSSPAPVVDMQLHRDEGLGGGPRIHLWLAAIAGNCFFVERAWPILAAYRLAKHFL